MEASSSSSSSSSSQRPRMTYDVFISFRGEDTRNNFTGFLYEALHQLGIMTFIDHKKLQIGDTLSENLLKAIAESRSSVVVISKDYASSKWCLRELAKIMDTMAETTHRVLPVFHHVTPSNVKHQSGSFKKSFDDHEQFQGDLTDLQKEQHLKEVKRWRDAMTKLADHTGELVTKDRPEVDVVKKIANQIFNTWRPKLVASDENLVGMMAPLHHMNVRLGLGLDDVRFVGIVGSGGIGKTTIAKVIYDCIAHEFEGSCFLRIPRHSSKGTNDLVTLQQQLLRRLLPKEDIGDIWDEDFGAERIKNYLSGRKVLVVLDGIDDKSQLQMLAASPDWFGAGSRVIITTRNRDSLQLCHKDKMVEYNVKLLNSGSALQLFCKQASGNDHSIKNLMDLGVEIIKRVNGLPLALKVIGSYLYQKDRMIWEETSKRLLKIDENNLFDILKISYDRLGAESQNVFLDLACFFNGNGKDRVVEILESFGYSSPHSDIQLLIERCLVEVSNKKLLIHDLIQDLGQEIVRRESLTQPGKQTRIWLRKDVDHIFNVKDGLKYTRGIVLNLEEQEELMLEAKSFMAMNSLKILQISNVKLSEDIKSLSNVLGFLNWPGFPSKCLPSNFHSPHLFELYLPRSSLQFIWEGGKKFDELKVIDVRDSNYLLETPDFSNVPKLERLILRNCRKLHHVHPSINCLDHLVLLDFKHCSSFRSFSSSMRCKKLEILILSGSGLVSFPEIETNMECLTQLLLDETPIIELHSSIERLTSLVLLNLQNCTMLSNIPTEIGNLRSLKILILNGCKNLEQIPPSLGNLESIEYLDIGKTSISRAPSTIHRLKNLRELNCERLSRSVWHSLLPPYSTPRSVSEVPGLKLFGYSFGLVSLIHLNLKGCNLVDEDIPKDLHCFSSLQILDLSENHLVRLPESICHLQSLQQLNLNDCIQLQQLTKLPESLKFITCNAESSRFILENLRKCHRDNSNIKQVAKEFCTCQSFIEKNVSEGRLFSKEVHSPEVFTWQTETREGNQIEIQYDRESSINNDRRHIYGVALFTCVQCYQNTDDHEDTTSFSCQISIVLESEMYPWATLSRSHTFNPGTTILMTYIPFEMFPKMPSTQNSSCLKATVRMSIPFITVEKCGASVLYQHNAPDFLAKMLTYLHDNRNKLYKIIRGRSHRISKHGFNTLDTSNQDHDSSPTVESTVSDTIFNESDRVSVLKWTLKSVLQRTFEEEKPDLAYYSFPIGEISGWFHIQQPGDTVAIKLPRQVHKNKKWMGLAIFAVFSLREDPECMKSPLNYSFSYQTGSAKDRTLLMKKGNSCGDPGLNIPLFLVNGSHKILFVAFNPQDQYPYEINKWDHLRISFITNVASVKVELCGARLVYRENVEGLIHTIMDCALKSGEELYGFYHHETLKHLIRTFYPQRHHIRYIYPSLKQAPGHLSKALTPSDSFDKLQHESFEKSIQDRYGSKFDMILHGNEIPKFFTSQSTGNVGTVRLSTKRMGCLGFLACALMAEDRQVGKHDKIADRESCVRVLDFTCQFEVDSLEVIPAHHHFVPEQKLLSQYGPQFIWLFYTPLAAFDDVLWHLCNDFKSKVSTNNEEIFRVQQCGLHVVYRRELQTTDNLLKLLFRYQP